MPQRPCIFLSACSQEFEPARADLAALLRKKGYEVKVQEDFHQGPGTTLAKLDDYIRQCSHVICLMGLRHGGEPPENTVPADTDSWLRANHPTTPLHPASATARLSYTQWEFYLALRHQIPLYVFIASATWPGSAQISQPPEDATLQQAHLTRVKALGWDRDYFSTWEELKERVLILPIPTLLRPGLDSLRFATLGSLFKGRDQFLLEIRRQVETSLQRHGHMPKHAIHALGGVGKTRAALEYAWRHGDLYTARFFLTARSPQDLEDQLATLCDILDLPEKALPELAPRLQAALRWLGDPQNKNYLLILDNVDDEPTARAIEKKLASLHHGHLLICGRITQWTAHITTLELRELSPESAQRFLLDRTHNKRAAQNEPADAAAALSLAADLGHLALALEQAAAYITVHRISFPAYQTLLKTNALKVLAWTHHTVTDYERPIAATWLTSISQLSEEAQNLLRLLSEYSPAPIPRFLFESEKGETLLDSLAELRNHSLITD
ncbi:MAG TPA: DUF4062 domain-containing protein, partial [Prosthecobacter sp.]|nr:DUF4062 domain-containing protein [Prosthecobacter sp.]